MISHLKNNHKTIYTQLKTAKRLPHKEAAPQQPTIAASFAQGQLYPCHGKRWKELTDSVTRFIVKDSLPIHTVTKNGFKDMIKSLTAGMKFQVQRIFLEQRFQHYIPMSRNGLQLNYKVLTILHQPLTCGPVLGVSHT